MKIMAVCGQGLGSSFMMEMNIKKVLKKHGISAQAAHSDLASITEESADIFVMGQDIAESASVDKEKIVALKSIVSLSELEEKLVKKIK